MRTLAWPCPKCKRVLDAYTCASPDLGEPDADEVHANTGDLTVCRYCATILIFNHDQSLRCASDEEMAELDADLRQEVMRIQAAVKRAGVAPFARRP